MARNPFARASSGHDRPDWRLVNDLLQSSEYEQLAELLREAQAAFEDRPDPLPAHALALAIRLCLACNQSQAEAEWYRQARQEATRREQHLRGQIYAILNLPDRAEPCVGPSPWTAESRPPEAAARPGLWQRLLCQVRRLGVRQPDTSAAPREPARPAPFLLDALPPLPSVPGTGQPAPSGPMHTKAGPLPAEAAGEGADEESEGETAAAAAHVPPPPPEAARPGPPSGHDAPATKETPPPPPSPPRGGPAPAPVDAAPAAPDAPVDPHASTAAGTARERKQAAPPPAAPSLLVYSLGPFEVYQDDHPVLNWPSSKGRSIFKYLVTHRERPVSKEVLMELFWPDSPPDAARNNLNVAVYGLRQALREGRPSFSHVLFQDGSYLLNPGLQVWVDVEEFEQRCQTGRDLERQRHIAEAMREYRAADALYQGEFLEEDRYEDWVIPLRHSLQAAFLSILDRLSCYYLERADYASCAAVCQKMLLVDACSEDAHRRLMRCHSRQGQPYLGLRQYHLCVQALNQELEVTPAPETIELYDRIRHHQPIYRH